MLHCFIHGWLVRKVARCAAVEADSNEDPNDQDLGDREKQDMEKASKSRGVSTNPHHGHDCSKDEDTCDHEGTLLFSPELLVRSPDAS